MPGGTGLSLREAITIANATAGVQTITFQSGIVVLPSNTLPTITDGVNVIGGVLNAGAVPASKNCLTIAAGPTTIDGLEIFGCPNKPISVGGNDVHIRSCNVHQNGAMLEVASTATTGTIIGPGNVISGSGSHCVSIYDSNALIIDNRISDCGADGVLVSGGSVGTQLVGNLILRANVGIAMAPGATGTVMWHNTIVRNLLIGINIAQSSSNDLRNNILALNGSDGVSGTDSKFTQQDYNSFFGNGGSACNGCSPGPHSVQLDPKFTNSVGDDYTLQSGSPAIDAGTPLGVDRNGAGAGLFDGAAPDIGFREHP